MIREKAKYIKRKSRKASAYNRAVTQINRAKIRIKAHIALFVSSAVLTPLKTAS